MFFSKLLNKIGLATNETEGFSDLPNEPRKFKFSQQESLLFDALAKAQNSYQAYRYANEIANLSVDVDKKIRALQKVIEICEDEYNQNAEFNPKLKLINFWAYGSLGNLFAQKADNEELSEIKKTLWQKALKNYGLAYSYGKDNAERIGILNKMAQINRNLGDELKWWELKEEAAGLTDDMQKREAYVNMAQNSTSDRRKVKYLDIALQYVMAENTSVLNKCFNTLKIADELKNLYLREENYVKVSKMQALIDKTVLLLINDLEQKFADEDDRRKKLNFQLMIWEVENRYLNLNDKYQQERIAKIYDLMDVGDVINLGDGEKVLRK